MRGKKGGEKLLSIWWFMMIATVATGIVIGVSAYYSAEVNTKGIEAEILSERVLDCMNQNGFVQETFLRDGFDILKECKLSARAFEPGSNFFFRASLYDAEGKLIKSLQAGDASFEKSCSIAEKVKAVRFPVCTEKKEGILYFDRGSVIKGELRVFAGSNQDGRRIIAAI